MRKLFSTILAIFFVQFYASGQNIYVTPTPNDIPTVCLGDTITFTVYNSPQNTVYWGWEQVSEPIVVEPNNTFNITMDNLSGYITFYCFDANYTVLDSVSVAYNVHYPYLSVSIFDGVCQGDPINVEVANFYSYQYSISFPNGFSTPFYNTANSNTVYTFYSPDYQNDTVIIFTVIDSICTMYFDSVIDFLPLPTFAVSGLQNSYCPGDTATLTVSGNANYYWWDTTAVNVVGYNVFPPYEISFIVSDTSSIAVFGQLNNCEDWMNITLNINCDSGIVTTTIPLESGNLIVYSGFTPNGDGINDVWQIDGIEQYDNPVAVIIFNRWGDIIWQTDNYDNQKNVFRGEGQNGETIPDGTYFYVVKSGETKQKGFLELLR